MRRARGLSYPAQMLTRGGSTAAESRSAADSPLAQDLQRARFDAGAAARTLARLCAREGTDLAALDAAVQGVRLSVGRLHEVVAALLITHK